MKTAVQHVLYIWRYSILAYILNAHQLENFKWFWNEQVIANSIYIRVS